MRNRHACPVHNGTPEDGQPDSGRDKLVLKPRIFIEHVILDLVEFEFVKIFTLVVVAHDRPGAPLGAASTELILQADE